MTTVFIWNNNIQPEEAIPSRAHRVIGHAALNIDDLFDRGVGPDGMWVDNTASYVSYWPGSEPAELEGSAAFWDNYLRKKVKMTRAKKAKKQLNFWADVAKEQYAPDHIIRIRHNRAPGSVDRMRAKWQETFEKEGGPNYSAAIKNCSRLAARVLRAGFHSKLPFNSTIGHHISGIWTPLMVKRLALWLVDKVGGEELTWAEFLDEQHDKGNISAAACAGFKNHLRRASNRGEDGGATPRFQFNRFGRFKRGLDPNPEVFSERSFIVRYGKKGSGLYWEYVLGGHNLYKPDVVERLILRAAKANKHRKRIRRCGIWYKMNDPWSHLWENTEGFSIDLSEAVRDKIEELNAEDESSSED